MAGPNPTKYDPMFDPEARKDAVGMDMDSTFHSLADDDPGLGRNAPYPHDAETGEAAGE